MSSENSKRVAARLRQRLAASGSAATGGAVSTGSSTMSKALIVYYDTGTKYYWMRTPGGDFIPVSRGDLIGHFTAAGISPEIYKGQWQSDVEKSVLQVQREQYVDWAGPLAGHAKGFLQQAQTRLLVTSEPSYIAPAPGDWPLLGGILQRMLGELQMQYFLGWVSVSLRMFHSRIWRAGQAVALCGPPGAGKNLLTALLRVLFGGRMPGKPYSFMTGRTDFNADFFGSELLTIEDEAESTSFQARRTFGAALKMMTVNEVQWLHAKGRQALSVTVLQRLVVSLNDDPERLMVLPPIEPDIADKIILFKVAFHEMPMPTSTPEEQKAFWDALVAELPRFVYFLQSWTIPADLVSPRFGVKHFHHPELLAVLQELSPEQRLMELIDDFIFAAPFTGNSWEGRSTQLDRELKHHSNARCAREAEKLLPSTNSCGKYLGRLQKLYPARVSQRMLNGHTEWTILAPSDLIPPVVKPAVSFEMTERLRAKGIISDGNRVAP